MYFPLGAFLYSRVSELEAFWRKLVFLSVRDHLTQNTIFIPIVKSETYATIFENLVFYKIYKPSFEGGWRVNDRHISE